MVTGAVALFCVIYFFGRTVPPKQDLSAAATTTSGVSFDIQQVIQASKARLHPDQQAYVARLENAVVRGNVKAQQVEVYRQLAEFYRDTVHLLMPFAYYTAEAAKLENSEKSLTFAARFFLDNARKQEEDGPKKWMAIQSKELFEKALEFDPDNDSLKVGLGSCYIFGNISDNPMQGITMIREVAERDPSNMYAQYMLGMGGLLSGQLNRAIERLTVVAEAQPDNLEVKLMLAEAFERKGDKASAVKWYESVKPYIVNPNIAAELDKRIQLLKN